MKTEEALKLLVDYFKALDEPHLADKELQNKDLIQAMKCLLGGSLKSTGTIDGGGMQAVKDMEDYISLEAGVNKKKVSEFLLKLKKLNEYLEKLNKLFDRLNELCVERNRLEEIGEKLTDVMSDLKQGKLPASHDGELLDPVLRAQLEAYKKRTGRDVDVTDITAMMDFVIDASIENGIEVAKNNADINVTIDEIFDTLDKGDQDIADARAEKASMRELMKIKKELTRELEDQISALGDEGVHKEIEGFQIFVAKLESLGKDQNYVQRQVRAYIEAMSEKAHFIAKVSDEYQKYITNNVEQNNDVRHAISISTPTVEGLAYSA